MKANKNNVNETSITTTIGNTTISAIDENILTIARANLNGLNVPIGSDAYNKALQIQSLDVLGEKTAIERCRLAYELKQSCEKLGTTFKDLCIKAKELTKSSSWDYSNMNKDANAYISVLQNDTISDYFKFASVTVLRTVQSCKNFAELIKAIENGLLIVPTTENSFKSSTVKEFSDVVKLINAGLVNISADNIARDEQSNDEQSNDEQSNDEQSNDEQSNDEQSNDEQSNEVTLNQLLDLYNSASEEIRLEFLSMIMDIEE